MIEAFLIGIVLFILWAALGKFIALIILIAAIFLVIRGACGG